MKRFVAIIVIFSFLFTFVSMEKISYANELKPVKSSTILRNQYWGNWSKTLKSYLYSDDNNIFRVEYINKYDGKNNNSYVVVEKYDEYFNIVSSKKLHMELPIWGGFYSGEKFNFLIFGDNNKKELDDKEVIRVVKYDKEWKRLGEASLKGANTTVPFRAASLRCDEYKDMLYIRTAHEMYKLKDGLNHQANLTMSIRQSNMEITDSFFKVMNIDYGYVSHSFNQFITVDKDKNIVALDHGDAYPRSIVITKYGREAGGDKFNPIGWDYMCKNVDILKLKGKIGDNYTGAEVGGFVETSDGYLVSYNYKDDKALVDKKVYLTYISKENVNSEKEELNTVKLSDAGKVPVLAPLDLNSGYVMWNDNKGKSKYGFKNLLYAKYDEESNVGDVHKVAGIPLSDCQPINYKDGVLWYVTKGSVPTFYFLNDSGVTAIKATSFDDVKTSDWFYDSVNYCKSNGYVKGVSDEKFDSYGNATREAFATVLYRIDGKKSLSNEERKLPFSDLAKDRWSFDAINWAYNNQIIKGTSKTAFSPKNNVTNEQIMTLLYRYAKVKGVNFKDGVDDSNDNENYKDISDYAKQAVNWSIVNGIIETDNDRFIPKKDASRAELTYMLYRFSKLNKSGNK